LAYRQKSKKIMINKLRRINKLPKNKIMLGPPYLTRDDEKEVIKVIRSGQLSLGPMTEKFENNFADWIGSTHAVATSSGTSALHLCVRALGIEENDEVITSPFSFVSSANCILYEKAKPVFVDIDPVSLNIDADKIEQAITSKTKAILIVHIFGLPADLDKIYAIAKKNNLSIIEDAAEALGATYKGKKIGIQGNLTAFAFYANKQMTTGEGGMITTNSVKQYQLLKSLVNQGRKINSEWLHHQYLGYNYRLDELSAALGVSQLNKLDLFLKNRQRVARWYNQLLKNNPEVALLENDNDKIRSWFVYVIKLKNPSKRDKLMTGLRKCKIPSRAYLPPIHLQPFYKEMFSFKKGDFPVCEKIASQTLALPFYTGMIKNQVELVCNTFNQVLKSVK